MEENETEKKKKKSTRKYFHIQNSLIRRELFFKNTPFRYKY